MTHYYQTIKGFTSFEKLYRQQVERAPADAPSLFVELGTCLGKSAAYLGVEILNSGKPIALDTWDSWFGCPKSAYHVHETGDALKARAEAALAPVAAVVTVHTGDALGAAVQYEDASCDFVFVDDDHSYDHVLEECRWWWPKVKPGGVLAGHDWGRHGTVRAAVVKWAGEAGVTVTPTKDGQNCWVVQK